MSEIRFDRLRNRDVIIAPERLHRPSSMSKKEERRAKERACPFCEGNEAFTPSEIFALREDGSFKDKPHWKTRVVPNLFKALQIEAPHQHHYGFFEHWEGFGAHEVLIDTPNHTTTMEQWSEQNARDWLRTLQARFRDLRRDSRIASIILFKNEGSFAGATQPHCHTQIIGLPLTPREKKWEYKNLHDYYRITQKSLIAQMIEEEYAANRVIGEVGEFVAFCPYASAHPFEVMISSHRALGELDALHERLLESMASLLLDLIKRLKNKVRGRILWHKGDKHIPRKNGLSPDHP
jgi:UDPglucose--hexose-1-phosphate uridylyltransferase